MPSLTAFSWSPPQTESLMQICGMKRKTEDTQTGDSAMQEQIHPKRHCSENLQGAAALSFESQPYACEDTASAMEGSPVKQQSHLHHPPLDENLNNNNNDGIIDFEMQRLHYPEPVHQPSVDMNINGETYTCCETESMEASMESDCVPDQTQYSCTPKKSTDTESQFCMSFCGKGEESPNSGRVRCYCKPSWEGMLEMRPYMSDIY